MHPLAGMRITLVFFTINVDIYVVNVVNALIVAKKIN